MIPGWRISFRIWISLETRSTSATSTIFSFYRILTATFCPVGRCTADLTFPKVPFPSVFPVFFDAYQLRSFRWSWTWSDPAPVHVPPCLPSLSNSRIKYIPFKHLRHTKHFKAFLLHIRCWQLKPWSSWLYPQVRRKWFFFSEFGKFPPNWTLEKCPIDNWSMPHIEKWFNSNLLYKKN